MKYVLTVMHTCSHAEWLQMPVASFTKEVNPQLAKRLLVFNGRLAIRGLTSLVKEATGINNDLTPCARWYHTAS